MRRKVQPVDLGQVKAALERVATELATIHIRLNTIDGDLRQYALETAGNAITLNAIKQSLDSTPLEGALSKLFGDRRIEIHPQSAPKIYVKDSDNMFRVKESDE